MQVPLGSAKCLPSETALISGWTKTKRKKHTGQLAVWEAGSEHSHFAMRTLPLPCSLVLHIVLLESAEIMHAGQLRHLHCCQCWRWVMHGAQQGCMRSPEQVTMMSFTWPPCQILQPSWEDVWKQQQSCSQTRQVSAEQNITQPETF